MSVIEDRQESLELLALSTYESIMTDIKADPKVRKDAADSVMKLYGHFDVRKQDKDSVALVSFPDGIRAAVAGVDVFQQLLGREEAPA